MNVYVNENFYKSELRIINNRRRREAELKRHILIFAVSFIAIIILLSLSFSLKSVASSKDDVVLYKFYDSVEIESGDTLMSISNKYYGNGFDSVDSFMKEIMYINGINENSILISGNYLVIPFYDTYLG